MRLSVDGYRALAEFRYQIRKFLAASEEIALSARLRPQQYVMLLMLRGLPAGKEPTVQVLAERLRIRHNSAVELANRLSKRGLIRRSRSKEDSRKVFIHLTRNGAALIEKLVERRIVQLHSSQPELIRALNAVLSRTYNKGNKRKAGCEDLSSMRL